MERNTVVVHGSKHIKKSILSPGFYFVFSYLDTLFLLTLSIWVDVLASLYCTRVSCMASSASLALWGVLLWHVRSLPCSSLSVSVLRKQGSLGPRPSKMCDGENSVSSLVVVFAAKMARAKHFCRPCPCPWQVFQTFCLLFLSQEPLLCGEWLAVYFHSSPSSQLNSSLMSEVNSVRLSQNTCLVGAPKPKPFTPMSQCLYTAVTVQFSLLCLWLALPSCTSKTCQ